MPPDTELSNQVEKFIRELKQETHRASFSTAYYTVVLLRKIVSQAKWRTARDLMVILKDEGRKLTQAQPTETVVGNMIRRVIKIVREEYASSARGKSEETSAAESLQTLLLAEEVDDYNTYITAFKQSVIEAINEFLTELETSGDNVAEQSLEHIHSNEVIMTVGKSKIVETFLKRAAKKRKFQVMVVECAPFYHGQQLAISLAKDGIDTTVITDSAVFAIMSRVNKVIIGTHTVMANGGLKAVNGSHAVALAARHHSVPLVVCAPMYKLSPQYLCTYDQDAFNKFVSPEDVMKFSEGEILSKAQIYNPVFDYVPPELVTLFISNIGGNAPSYVYRLLSEFYHPDDHEL